MSALRPVTAADWRTLPAGLLSIAKSHLRIDGTYDDHYIERTIARAISQFERSTNVSVNPVTWAWLPDSGNFCNGLRRRCRCRRSIASR